MWSLSHVVPIVPEKVLKKCWIFQVFISIRQHGVQSRLFYWKPSYWLLERRSSVESWSFQWTNSVMYTKGESGEENFPEETGGECPAGQGHSQGAL